MQGHALVDYSRLLTISSLVHLFDGWFELWKTVSIRSQSLQKKGVSMRYESKNYQDRYCISDTQKNLKLISLQKCQNFFPFYLCRHTKVRSKSELKVFFFHYQSFFYSVVLSRIFNGRNIDQMKMPSKHNLSLYFGYTLGALKEFPTQSYI